MKEDKAITAVGVLAVILSLLMMSVGRFIMGGITLLLAFGIFWNRGGGKRNDRSIYEKIVKTDMSIAELYEKLRDLDTPLGKPWIAEYKGFSGDSIVFGPCSFKDCVVISRGKNFIDVKHVTRLENIIRKEEDEYRFENLVNPQEAEVTPERYAVFAGFKLASVMLVKHLAELIEKLHAERDAKVPETLDFYRFYYHNSVEGCFRDSDGNDVLAVETSLRPFTAKVSDADGNEMASVVPHAFDSKGYPAESAGFELFADGRHFGEIRRFRDSQGEGFEADTEAGVFRMILFPSCMKAKISCNYMIEHEGKLKAVIGGSPNLLFDQHGRCRNDLVISYDDDYLVLYAIAEIFILTNNSKFLK
ncbi:MAG: hypothetical protein IJJ03_02580 [Mogibacterium sp.]|nr:hypothetical protein [Mogibacterium sp.]MBQ6502019.1 hypothetical protein [Mogibacterium sp.]